MVAARDDVGARRFQLRCDLGGQPEPPGGVLAVHHREVRPQLFLQGGQNRLDGIPAGMANHVGYEQNFEVAIRHQSILAQKKKGARLGRTPFGYFAYSIALVSRTTVTRI